MCVSIMSTSLPFIIVKIFILVLTIHVLEKAANFAHNMSTQQLLVQMFDIADEDR
jgi:hypothetical protein